MNDPQWKPGDSIDAPSAGLLSIDPTELDTLSVYKLLIGSIVPRPIAFVSTINAAGVGNLAPFSFYNGAASNPPCIMFSVSRKPNGDKKDTLVNIEETRQFVVNSANLWLAGPLVHSAADYPSGVDELQKVGLTPLPSKKVKPVRVKEAAVQMECELYNSMQIGDGSPGSAVIVVGRIVMIHLAESVYKDGKILLEELKPLARLGGFSYCEIGQKFSFPIPKL